VSDDLAARVDAAVAARPRGRPLADTVAALAAAADRWRADPALAGLAPEMGLSRALVDAAVALAADALDPAAMTALVEDELGAGAARGPAPDGPALVAHVVASNVPALALPAIAHACLAGAAVLVKSGRDDRLSAPAFQRALAAVDPALGATVVPAYWPGGDPAHDAVLRRADVVVVTGGEAAVAAFAGRSLRAVVTHGPRFGVALVGREALADAGRVADAIALDVALHDQRGCLSPHVIYVETGGPLAPRAFAEGLAAALDAVAARLPPGPLDVAERARARLAAAEADWLPDALVLAGAGGCVVYAPTAPAAPTPGRRTVRVHPLARLVDAPPLLPDGAVECVGVAGVDPAPLVAALRARGVSRVCPVGRMQCPPVSWPRGQRRPLAALRGRFDGPHLEVEG
jgi:hypothetical protein